MHIRAFLILLFALCIFYSCQKKFQGPANILTDAPARFSAQINAAPFRASVYGATIRSDSVISIAAKSDDNKMLVFTVTDSGVHSYTLDINSKLNVAGYIDVAGLAFTSNGGRNSNESGGNLTIAFIDTTRRLIGGTFHFKGFRQADMQQRIITEGVFENISY